ncbi:MAG: flavodoxin family protein [Thermoplasmata archaeon]|nr:flavodoxin family protein [Thermoplasmata archaeon]
MKVLAINGSPRPLGNVSNILSDVRDMFEREGIETEFLHIYDYDFTNCNVCMTCEIRGDGRCYDEDDGFNQLLDAMRSADAILIATPTYMNGCPSMLQTFLERAMLVLENGGLPLRGKVGGVFTICGHDGGSLVYNQMTDFLLRNRMLVVGAYPLPIIRSWHSPDYENDREGMKGVKSLVEGMVDALVRLEE